MKRKKGFTLIELLAVIVVLAVIALIATPIILNIIEMSKRGAAEESVTSYVRAIETEVMLGLKNNSDYKNKDDYAYDEIEVNIKGIIPTSGIYALEDGSVKRGAFCINGYEVKYDEGKTEIQGKCTGSNLKLSGSVKLSQNTGTYEYPTSGTFEITENISGGTLTCISDDEEVATCTISGTTVTVTPGTKEGTATLIIKSEENSKYKEAQAAYVATTASGTLTSYTAIGYDGVYDGSEHGITVILSGATIKYGTSEGSYTLDESPTYIDAGEYTVYYQITKTGFKTITGSKKVIIAKKIDTISITAKTGMYTGSAQAATFGATSGLTPTVTYYSDSSCSTAISGSPVNVGTYYAKATTAGNTNYKAVSLECAKAVTINKANNILTLSANSGSYTYPTTGTFTVEENISGGILSCETSDSDVADCTMSGTTVIVTPGTKEGSATLTIKSEATENYYEGQVAYVAITASGTLTGYTVNAYDGVYDGNPHGITVTASGATIKYGTTEGSYTLDASPTYTNVGEYTVYYQITKTGYKTITGSKKVIISKAENPISVTAKSLTYTGSAQALVTVSGAQGNVCYSTSSAPTSCTSAGTIPKGTNAGSYKVYYYVAGNTNYASKSGTVDVTVAKKADTISITAKTGTYSGSAQAATFSATSGLTPTVTYYSDSSCSTKVSGSPVNAGTYYAKATTAGNTNYKAGSLGCKKAVTINKTNNTLTISTSSGSYTYPTKGTFTVDENKSGGALSCETDNSSVATCSISGTTVTVTPGTTAGTATLTIKSAATTNYNAGQAAHVATTALGTLSVTANGYDAAYDGNAHGITVTSSGATIKYGTSSGSYTLNESPTYKGIGTYTVYYQVTKAGFKTVTGSKNVVISKASIATIAKTLVYDENGICKTDGTTYNYMGGCYIKGASTSNYVWYNGFMWRIMGINSDGTVRLITDENVATIDYGAANSGLTYETNEGYIHDWLNEYFYNSLNSTKSIIKKGAYFCSETTNSTILTEGRQTCTSGSEITTKIGLISIDEYLLSNTSSSYLNIRQSSWTMTPYSTSYDWNVYFNGKAHNHNVTYEYGVRPVINVSSDATITSGDGSARDFFVLGEDKTISVTGVLSEKATSGEYVNLEGHTYRVVSKDSDGVKLILDGFYEETVGTPYTMAYGSDNTFTLDSGIGQKLNGDVLDWLKLTESDKIVETTYYQGDGFGTVATYTDTLKQSNGVEAKVGLIQVGDILAGQSSTMLTKNYTTTSSYSNTATYWTMNKDKSTSYAWTVYNIGEGGVNNGVTYYCGVRPVITVRNDLNITSGTGTWKNPYEI